MPIIRKETLDVDFVLEEIKKNTKAIKLLFENQNLAPVVNYEFGKLVRPACYIKINDDYIDIGNPKFTAFIKGELTCTHCGITGSFFAKEKDNPKAKHFHLHLYAIDPDSEKEILMLYASSHPTSPILRIICSHCYRKFADQYRKIFQNYTPRRKKQKNQKTTIQPSNQTTPNNLQQELKKYEEFNKPFKSLLQNFTLNTQSDQTT